MSAHQIIRGVTCCSSTLARFFESGPSHVAFIGCTEESAWYANIR